MSVVCPARRVDPALLRQLRNPATFGGPGRAVDLVTTCVTTCRDGAERRVCSLLFCDLVGFTALTVHWDPEDVCELMSRYYETASLVIRRYGGTRRERPPPGGSRR